MPLWLENWLEVSKLFTLLLVQLLNVLRILLVSINAASLFDIFDDTCIIVTAANLWPFLLNHWVLKLGRCLRSEVEFVNRILIVDGCGVSFEVTPHKSILKKDRFVLFNKWTWIGSGSIKSLLNLIYFLLTLWCCQLVVGDQLHDLRHIDIFAIIWVPLALLLFKGGLFNW
jgi:hypothetical protein